jgi:hypothetical protein
VREGGRAGEKTRGIGFNAAAGTICRDDRDYIEDEDDDEEGKARQDGGHGREGGRRRSPRADKQQQQADVRTSMPCDEVSCGCALACLSLCVCYVYIGSDDCEKGKTRT